MFPTGDMLRFCFGTLLFAWKSVSLFPFKMDGATASDFSRVGAAVERDRSQCLVFQ